MSQWKSNSSHWNELITLTTEPKQLLWPPWYHCIISYTV